jgi:bifunctional NMN adenylyltransferase/nudix hydrolase
MDVGVVVGRFQVDKLHEGHVFLINRALANHRKVIVFIGVSPRAGKADPLDYPTRERMVRAEFPEVWVLPLKDQGTDQKWSANLDEQVDTLFPGSKAVLYGGRDSFVPHYVGKHQAIEVDSGISYMSGTQLREDIGKVVRTSPEFRAGIIYHSQSTVPRPVICCDIAVVKQALPEPFILMGKKDWDVGFRLPGGKVEITDKSLEMAARRELIEETNVGIEGKLTFLGSDVIRDWRDGGKDDVIYMSAVYLGWYTFGSGTPKAGSDLAILEWIPLSKALELSNKTGQVQVQRILDYMNRGANE